MAALQVTINIDAEPTTPSFQLDKLRKTFGDDDAAILSRLVSANHDGGRTDRLEAVLRAVCEAVRVTEAV